MTEVSEARPVSVPPGKEIITYNDAVVRKFLWASVVFSLVGMLVGVIIALQLAFWPANMGQYLSFGRLRPVHTNAVIFAFVGNYIFAGIYYSTQRLLKTRVHDGLANAHFWLWQTIIAAAAVSLPLGFTQGKEYSELEWPIDILVTITWVVFAIAFFHMLIKRREKHLYVAVWFYIATIITIAVLYIVNNLSMPVGLFKSYSVFGGVQDALVEWWYGHNAVAFFLTTPVLGLMYYFVPKAAERPVYSYRLSIIHFWALVFIYIWAGPHHLLYTALPDWAQTLGMVFSLMLWAPSWGGMLNGLFTLRGAWDRLRTDPVLKFFAVGITTYGMVTLEGPLLSIKAVSGLAHYTDWIIAHVHNGGLGWNGFMGAGIMYWLVPRLYGKEEVHSVKAANFHFWIGTIGIVLYVGSMWVAGITQGLMWKATVEGGGLEYTGWVETVEAINPMYWMRLIGGTIYLLGFVVMVWNLVATARAGKAVDGSAEVPVHEERAVSGEPSTAKIVFGGPVILSAIGCVLLVGIGVFNVMASIVFSVVLCALLLAVALGFSAARKNNNKSWHALLEGRALAFTLVIALAILVGGVAELVPSLIAAPEAARATDMKPYSALELEGRDVYLREGCYTCHSQMVRPFDWEAARFGGKVSRADDSIFDHPFQWGSRRIGPDLAHVGLRRDHVWQYEHFVDPRAITDGSNMPPYAHLSDRTVDFNDTPSKLRAMRNVGVPYSPEDIQESSDSAWADARAIAGDLAKTAGVETCEEGSCELRVDSEMVALVAYMVRLGNKEPVKHAKNLGDSKPAQLVDHLIKQQRKATAK